MAAPTQNNTTIWEKIKRDCDTLSRSSSMVGFPAGASIGKPISSGSGHVEYGNMTEVARIAYYNEYGTSNMPERSFMRPAFINGQKDLEKLSQVLYKKMIEGTIGVKTVLGQMGKFHVNQIRKQIRHGIYVPNEPETIERKSRGGKTGDKPLIDTGQMINSVTHIEEII